MRKRFREVRHIGMRTAVAIIGATFCVSCLGPRIREPEMSRENQPEVLDDMYHQARDVPRWIFLEIGELEADAEGVYLFKFIESGRNLDGLKLWARGFSASSEIARMVTTDVRDKFVAAAVGDKDLLETYIEETVKSLSGAQYSGARKTGEYWWQVRRMHADGTVEDVYEYFLLYSVPQEQIDAAIRRALGEAEEKAEPKNEEEQKARERVKEAFEAEDE